MLSVKNLTKIYKIKGKENKQVVALNNVSIDFPDKGLVFLLGKSGSGKSTLLNTIGGLDKFDSGEIIIKGKSSKQFSQSDFDAYRNTFIGFIFQEYNILDEFTVGKNLALALELQGKKATQEEVEKLLDQVDLNGYYKRKPNQLSGGQKQRVAIARALIKNPEIIMADEPTGALDSNTGKQVMETLKKLSKTKLVIIVSHDRDFAEIYGDRVVELKDGQVISDVTKKEVLANKTASGVSFIDDKIVHIKKGQKLTKEDLLTINKLIVKNTHEEDTIISFDKKPNAELKKFAFITDEGNREVFYNTTPKDIKLKQYDPKQFKLLKSKMKMKDSFKMGVSSLKHKPIRLVFTILLSFVAFAMFGVVDTMASFNIATSTYDSMNKLNCKTVSVVKTFEESYNNEYFMMEDGLIESLSDETDYSFNKVIYNGEYFSFNDDNFSINNNNSNIKQYFTNSISGMIAIDETIKNNLQLNLSKGTLPTSDDEICVSQNIENTIKAVFDVEDVLGQKITIDNSLEFDIVGVIADTTDLSRYEKNMNGNNIDSWLKQSELNIISKYGTLNMCYVTKTEFNKLAPNYYSNNVNYNFGNYTLSNYSFYSIDDVKKTYDESTIYHNASDLYWDSRYNPNVPEGYVKDSFIREIKYLKEGYDLNNFGDNDIVIPYNSDLFFDLDEENIEEKINNGWQVNLNLGYGDKVFKTFNVVAVTKEYDYYSSNNMYFNGYYIVSQKTYKQMFSGYDYVITGLKGKTSDKDLVKYLCNYNDNGTIMQIQFASTPTLTNFGDTITSVGKVLIWVALGLAVFSGFMLMNFISTSIVYKRREIGVLRAIGAGKKDVFKIFFSESFVISLINAVLAIAGCIVACVLINNSLFNDLGFTVTLLSFGIRQILLMFGISLLVAFVSTFIPVWNIAKKCPIDSINNR